jgi:hypothetical protein
MPKNNVTDPITDQEIAFAHLAMSGTMTDRQAAEAVGLNPDTAAYTKSKPRVRAYMIEHRAAVNEKLVDHEVEGLRKLNISRDQILDRLWELATLSHEATRGTIAGQIKALSMIVAIEGLIPSGKNDRRLSPSGTQTAATPAEGQTCSPERLRDPQQQLAAEEPADPVADTKTQPAATHVPEPKPKAQSAQKSAINSSFPNLYRNQTGPLNPFIKPEALNRVPDTTGFALDAILDRANPSRLSFSPDLRFSGRRR